MQAFPTNWIEHLWVKSSLHTQLSPSRPNQLSLCAGLVILFEAINVVVYVSRQKIQINWGTKDGEIPFLLSPTQFFQQIRIRNENENRFCA